MNYYDCHRKEHKKLVAPTKRNRTILFPKTFWRIFGKKIILDTKLNYFTDFKIFRCIFSSFAIINLKTTLKILLLYYKNIIKIIKYYKNIITYFRNMIFGNMFFHQNCSMFTINLFLHQHFCFFITIF